MFSTRMLFNRSSPVVRALEVLGIVLSIAFFWKNKFEDRFLSGLFLYVVVSYLFLRICVFIPWYSHPNPHRNNSQRLFGIQVHFHKALVPACYALPLTSLVLLFKIPFLSGFAVTFSALVMLIITPVNVILIFFHLRDKDNLPINYFSSNQYKEEKATANHDQKLQISSH